MGRTSWPGESVGRSTIASPAPEVWGRDEDPQRVYHGFATLRTEVLKRLYDEMICESGINFTFLTNVIGVRKEADARVTHAVCAAKSGLFAVAAKTFVDGTGDGDLAAFAGAAFEKGDEAGQMMPGTLCTLWAGIDWEAAQAEGRNQQEALQEALAEGDFPIDDPHLPGLLRMGVGIGGGNLGHVFGVDGTCEQSLTRAVMEGRKMALEYQRFYQRRLRGFETMELAATASMVGIRESRRLLGDYVLGLDDFRRRAVFPDEIGRYCYPVDLHASRPGQEAFSSFWHDYEDLCYGKGESYGLPYRILTPRGLDNVLVAGRCLSADRALLASVRTMPGCYITGQAAGVAAALAAEGELTTREISVPELQRRLKAMGAFLPNLRATSPAS